MQRGPLAHQLQATWASANHSASNLLEIGNPENYSLPSFFCDQVISHGRDWKLCLWCVQRFSATQGFLMFLGYNFLTLTVVTAMPIGRWLKSSCWAIIEWNLKNNFLYHRLTIAEQKHTGKQCFVIDYPSQANHRSEFHSILNLKMNEFNVKP